MPVFKRDREEQQQNSRERVVSEAKKRIYKQAGLALTAILVTVALLFAMSTAWYSNVLEAGSLTFQAEKWELNAGNLSTDGSSVTAQPGARGILPITYKNTSDSIVNAYIGVSKDQMEVPLQKRIYFYTETPYTVGSGSGAETVARRYLTNGTAAPYTVLSMGQLTMSDEFCSVDTPIYWEWVYDLLGYYVKLVPTSDGSVSESEYLRPIVYDYDKATFDKDGNLATVDGEHFEKFLMKLSESDGYLNKFTVGTESYTGTDGVSVTYYIVDKEVDAPSYTAIRLLTKQEIAAANAWDTEQGKNGAFFSDLIITITGETANVDIINVGTTEQLTEALRSENGGYIRLSGNLDLTENITVSAKEPVILDLNGATLTGGSVGGGDLFTVSKGANLTVLNGTIKNSADNKSLFGVNNGRLTVSNVTATAEGDSQWGVYIQDNNKTTAQDGDSAVYITHSTISTGLPTVMIIGNNTTTAQKTRCVIESSSLTSGYVALYGNGQTVSGGTAIEVRDSTVTGKYAAVSQPQDNSTFYAENSSFTGNTGIVVKGGSMTLHNCTVTGVGTKGDPAFQSSGFSDTGAGIYLEAGYDRDSILITVTGENTLVKTTGYGNQSAVLLYNDTTDTKNKTRKARIAISGGTYSSDVKDYLANALFQSELNDDGFYTVATTKETQNGN